MLRIEKENIEAGLHLLRLNGALDGLTYLDLHKAMGQSIEDDVTRIVLDMNSVDYTSSAGLRVLLLGAKSLKEKNGEIVLFGMNQAVKEVFKLSGFDTMFRTYETEQETFSKL